MSDLGLPISPSRTIDVSAILGAQPGFFEINAYDGPNGHRFTFAVNGVENEGLVVPVGAMPSLAGLVGGVSLASTALIDFTETGTFNFNLPSMPGWYAVPIAMKLIAKTVTATAGPTVSVGNGTAVNGLDNFALEQGGWELAPGPATADIAGISGAQLVDLSTPIQAKVITGATGGSFTGFVLMVLQLFQIP